MVMAQVAYGSIVMAYIVMANMVMAQVASGTTVMAETVLVCIELAQVLAPIYLSPI